MRDPISSFEVIKENFIRYVETAFGTKFPSVEKERYDLLNYDKVLFRKPWIEPLPDYISSGKKISDLSIEDFSGALSDHEIKTFKELVKCGLFPDGIRLHSHQVEMLRKVMAGSNCIITSGTGSGKTESFLLPLFAQLSKEFTHWSRPGTKPDTVDNWWKANDSLKPRQVVNTSTYTLSEASAQRLHETRPAGVRALILYPMNALVEDQMSRLRKALDSDDTRMWLSCESNGNAIFFGRYNGVSPVPGELKTFTTNGTKLNSNKVNQLKQQLRIIEEDANRVEQYIINNNIQPKESKDLKSFFQRLDGAEMRSRFDMQLSPPDILITNYSMLSIMLMRQIDSGIFENTRAWLAGEDLSEEKRDAEKENRLFHLIIDELHLYRGTQGTEVAYLLKLVLNRLGLHPHHSQVRILASSASLEPGDDASKKFLEDFFGIDSRIKPFEIIEGRNNPVSELSEKIIKIPQEPFAAISRNYTGDLLSPDFVTSCEAAAEALAQLSGIPLTGIGIEKLLSAFVHEALQMKERLYSPCKNYKAICTIKGFGDNGEGSFFAESIFDISLSTVHLNDALKGLLIVRALLDEPAYEQIYNSLPADRKLPRFRFHYFFRNIEGIWASVDPTEVVAEYSGGGRTAGELFSTTRINSRKGKRVLELLYCDNCGTTLFGGSRLVTKSESGAHSFELLPISPNIEGIPEKTAAKLVERRSYQEYAVFWPEGDQLYTRHDPDHGIPKDYWRQATMNGIDQGLYEADWIKASLHKISGDIDFSHKKATENPGSWIKGYLFQVTENRSTRDIATPHPNGEINMVETHKALPCVCPACGVNHQKRRRDSRKSKTTPIRGFRTGFAKTTQIFAKELMYQLPDTENERKLIVFSDSREDAAQIANGIERNHFTDLLREIVVDELHSSLILRHHIVEALETGNTTTKNTLREHDPELYDSVEDLYDKSSYTGANTTKIREKEEAQTKLSGYKFLMINIRDLVHITNSLNLAPLVKKFAGLGINPGGNSVAIQERLLNGNYVPWYQIIDFENEKWKSGAGEDFISAIREGTYASLASMFFGTLFYSFESSGLGYVSINPEHHSISPSAVSVNLSREIFLQIINSCIRILGDKYKHNKVEDADPFTFTSYGDLPELLRKYIKAVADRHGISDVSLGDSVYHVLRAAGVLEIDTGIQLEQLMVKISKGTDPVWKSSRGNRPHLHESGGICTYSVTPLPTVQYATCSSIWEKNYLSYNAIIEKRKPIRLHCEELTGQTDDQFERQRHFRNIILPDEGEREVRMIDLLSVTTTLEVGVDIGALQAVMLGNMPPQRFNYQQRVGRAGRRGQAYSVILTFCRGRSHDEFYFANPHKITGDAPPTPFLTMNQERIFKRLLAKEIFRLAYIDERIDITNDDKSSVHGEFGSIGDHQGNWFQYKASIVNWILNNHMKIVSIVDCLLTPGLSSKKSAFIDWVEDISPVGGLIGKSQSIIDNEEISTNDISEKLAEGGILPMFGMPTTVRNLYHGIHKFSKEGLVIDRPQSMAIYEFAPGAQKTKDKAIHQVIGFTSDFIKTYHKGDSVTNSRTRTSAPHSYPFYLNRWFVRCRGCGFFETYSEETKSELEAQGKFASCPNCGEQNEGKYQKPVRLKAPRAYRTNLSKGSDSKDDSEFLLSRPPIFAEKINDPQNPDIERKVGNSGLIISDKDVTWRVNTNSDRYFTGRLYNTINRFQFNQQGYWFNDQWIMSGLAENFNENGYGMNVNLNMHYEEESIALASNKKTEIFRIFPLSVPLALNLNMFSSDSNEPYIKAQANGVRSGYYSAAFLLQRILADRLDVDPTEIEIADISMTNLDDGTNRKIAEIILTDELPNGSGFVRHLFDNFEKIIAEALNPSDAESYVGKIQSDSHIGQCKDACYDCLKVYRNMNYHSLLDWRLGLAMLRVMNNHEYQCGSDGNFKDFDELRGWLHFAKELRDSFAHCFGFDHLEEINGLPVIKFDRGLKNIIVIVHPFWDLQNIRDENWLAETMVEIEEYRQSTNGKISIIDTFNLHRRPGWCYEKLVIRR